MFIERLLNQGNAPLIEQAVKFSAARQKLLAEDMANVSTPGYVQKDLSVQKFQEMLRERADARDSAPVGSTTFDDVTGELISPTSNILFHDRNNRSVEQLMSDQAQNAMLHNMMIELLRRQFSQIQEALREKVS